ncbi:MAG: ATP synthase F0 subunit B [Acidobacteriaceae bacterium]|nr:ATP synthase F0 subunit B [Acidobacteriaceae bacterium]
MEATLQALGDLLIRATPTIFFFVLLVFYLKRVYFKPLAQVLEERRKETEGARELAQQAFESAERKQAEFEHALQIARVQIHQEHEALRRQWSDEQARELAGARAEADKQIEQAKRDIAREIQTAEAQLNAQVESLSQRIADSLLRWRAA